MAPEYLWGKPLACPSVGNGFLPQQRTDAVVDFVGEILFQCFAGQQGVALDGVGYGQQVDEAGGLASLSLGTLVHECLGRGGR